MGELSMWPQLPLLLMEKVFSHLDIYDRVNMVRAYPTWGEAFTSAFVWRTFRFALTESMLSVENCPVSEFVPEHRTNILHVDIDYCLTDSADMDLVSTWCERFKTFLSNMTCGTKITSVKIHNLMDCLTRIATSKRENIMGVIAHFLSRQSTLEKIELKNFSNNLQDYKYVLHIESRNSITYLGLHGFRNIRYPEDMERNRSTFLSIIDFPNLKTLATDYSNIFANSFCQSSMKTLENCEKRAKLSTIILYYDGRHDVNDYRGLTSADWKFLKTLHPNLRVELNFTTGRHPHHEVEFLIVRDMPIAYLYLAHGEPATSGNNPRIQIDVLLASIRQHTATDHLEYFIIKWHYPVADLSSTFITFLQDFNKLKHFSLFITYPASGLVLLLESLRENLPESLEEVCLSIVDVEKEKVYKGLQRLTRSYIPSLKLKGLNLKTDIKRK